MTILLVEQNARLALEVAHRGYVMESGAITLVGRSERAARRPEVREAYLGEDATDYGDGVGCEVGRVVKLSRVELVLRQLHFADDRPSRRSTMIGTPQA